MAVTVEETYDSRANDEKSMAGIFAQRSFIVSMDNATDDPITQMLENPPSGESLQLGELHPDPDYPIFITAHRKQRRLGPKSYLVQVTYGITSGTGDVLSHPEFPGWRVRMSSMNSEVQQTHTKQIFDADGVQIEEPRLIGFPAYDKVDFNESTIYYRESDEANQFMKVASGTKRRLPVTQFSPKASMSIVKEFPSFNYVVTSPYRLTEQIGRANIYPFMGFFPGTVKFIFWSTDVATGQSAAAGSSSSPYTFTVQLDFELDFTEIIDLSDRSRRIVAGHTPIQLAHTWTDDDGVEYPLFDDTIIGEDKRILENFHVCNSFDIGAMLNVIDSTHG